MHNRIHAQEKRDGRDPKVPQAFHVLDPTFIQVVTLLSKDFSLNHLSCSLCSLQLGTYTHFLKHRLTHLRNMSKGQLAKTQPVISIFRDLVHFIPIFHLCLYRPVL